VSSDNQSSSQAVLLCREGECRESSLELLAEEPLLIRVQDRPYVVVMRTPGDEKFQAAGFCLAEGIVDGAADFRTIGHDELQDANVVDVWLQPERVAAIGDILARQSFLSQSSCGICGKALLEDIRQKTTPLDDAFRIPLGRLAECLERLDEHQQFYRRTRASHAALLLDDAGRPLAFAEDVGRHNALDKAIGRALLEGRLERARLAVLSSRNSYELVQKAARARLPVMLSKSRATALAVRLAGALNITLAFPRRDELVIATAAGRITFPR